MKYAMPEISGGIPLLHEEPVMNLQTLGDLVEQSERHPKPAPEETLGTLPFEAAFSAFTNEVIWLIVISFFFARGFIKTRLGDRIATYFIKWLGGSTLGLSYGLTVSEACIAPAMPSTTARAGGVFLPIIKSLALSAGSKHNDQSSRKLGSYLVMTQFQVSDVN
ncbi:2-oxoglutarate/malate translocator, chloroplastic [Hordeum vulgare]|nr:2-oxoglutarate/malate translocator, chloroplastic [Hordeum vulgare]